MRFFRPSCRAEQGEGASRGGPFAYCSASVCLVIVWLLAYQGAMLNPCSYQEYDPTLFSQVVRPLKSRGAVLHGPMESTVNWRAWFPLPPPPLTDRFFPSPMARLRLALNPTSPSLPPSPPFAAPAVTTAPTAFPPTHKKRGGAVGRFLALSSSRPDVPAAERDRGEPAARRPGGVSAVDRGSGGGDAVRVGHRASSPTFGGERGQRCGGVCRTPAVHVVRAQNKFRSIFFPGTVFLLSLRCFLAFFFV